jgi:hypothetical protein
MTQKVVLSFLLIFSISSHAQTILGGGTLFSNAVTFNQSWLSGCPTPGITLSNQAAYEPTTAMDPCGAPAPACVTVTAGSDVWFSFFAHSTTATIVVNPSAGLNVAIQAFSGSACPGLAEIGCVNAAGNNQPETLALTGLTSGVRYYFRIFGAATNASARTGTYTFCGSAGLGSVADTDDDNDGIPDSVEGSTDTDGDGIINSLDADSDNDGIADIVEAGGADTNGDGRIDGTFADSDGDGLHDTYDASTGGDAIVNRDTDGDGIANAYDLDSDNDGIPDVVEAGGTDANNDGKIDGFTDTDNDGFAQSVDGDANNDGTAENMANALIITGTDTDSDGDPDSYPRANTDKLGLPNPYDLDADGDGILDTREAGLADANNDGTADGVLGTDGWSDTVDGLPGLSIPDSDSDGKSDYLDIDADNDGLTDNVEGQSTPGYLLPSGNDAADGDGIDDVYDNNGAAFGGNANNGITPHNHDGADSPDYIDSDSDNDGVNDLKEGSGNLNATLTNTADTDAEGLVDQFDIFNLNTETISIQDNVTLAGMGNSGSSTGPTLAGSNIIANQTPGAAPNRDWRNNLFVLPVKFVDVRLTATGGIYTILWTVAEEVNVRDYIVERSIDGQNFTDIGTVPYNNNGGTMQTYAYEDEALTGNSGTVYYRIRETDIDGRFMYSKVVSFRTAGNKTAILVLGNPVTGSDLVLNISTERSGIATLQLVDVKGRVLTSKKQTISTGDNTVRLPAGSGIFVNGTYFIQAVINGQRFVEKINICR